MKMILAVVLALFIGVVLFFVWASYPWSLNETTTSAEVIEVGPIDMTEISEQPSVIKILSYNIGFLYGRGSEGPGYEHRDEDYYIKALDKVSEEIKNWGADIVCLQEVDFSASRSHNINQATYIARKGGYPYVAQAFTWIANYVPFPYWPLKNNFGKMESGGAILSKYPLTDHEIHLFDRPESNPWWYNLFYPYRYFHQVSVLAGEKKFKVASLHLEAFDKKNRLEQISKIVEEIKNEGIDIIAGDFNMLPASATKKSNFYNDDNYENDSSYDVMNKSGLLEVIPEEIYSKDESSFFSFPSWMPDRRLDYIWYRADLKMMKAEVLSSASSDHLPLRATFQIDVPRFNPYSQ